jgi:hypothetical protein
VRRDEQEFDRIRGNNEAYVANCAREKTDGATQTVHNWTNHVGCQGATNSVTEAGTQCHGFDVTDAFDEAADGGAGALRDGDGHALCDRALYVERALARNALDGGRMAAGPGWVRLSAPQRRVAAGPDDQPSLEYCFAMDPVAAGRPAAAVSCLDWNRTETHMVAVGYDGPVNAVAVWSVKNPHAPER